MTESPPDPPDAQLTSTLYLVEAAQKGDRQALDDLFARHLPRVRQIVALRMGHRLRELADAEDLVQESLVKVLQGLDRFEHRTEGSFRNWLARCVECAIVDHRRIAEAKKRGGGKVRRLGDYGTVSLTESLFADRGPSPSEVVRGKEAEEKLEEALLALPSHYREILVLRHFCEMSYEEIARAMRFAQAATARRASSRAMEKLMALLEGESR